MIKKRGKVKKIKKKIVYLAGPLGFSEVGRLFYYTVLIPLVIEMGFEIRDPWKLTSEEIINSAKDLPYGQENKETWEKVNPIIGRNNQIAIKKADIIVAVLDGDDTGTASELGYAAAFKKKVIIGYLGDFRLSSDNPGCIVNLQVEYFIRLNGGEIVTSLEELKIALAKYSTF